MSAVMTYEEKVRAIAVAILNGGAHAALTEYLKLRGDNLLRSLRTAKPETFQVIQGRLDENDKLMDLIKAMEHVNDPENNG